MTTPAVTACVLALAICLLPATCKGQYYWGTNGWRQYWQPSNAGVCDRAYPARQTGGYVHSCRYLCSGLPVRYSFEQDGTPCYTNRWLAGACYAGRCQTGWWPVQQPAVTQAPATAAPVPTTERASLEGQGWSWPSEDAESQRCTRADPQVSTVRRSCRYLCKGWPIRIEYEEDGTACQLSWWREGFCFRGHCQRNYPLQPVPKDEDNEIEGGKDLARKLKCRNYKERVEVDGVVRSCKFVCKQRKKAFVAYEENGTPCAALPGQNGFCDHGVCKAVEATAAPTEAPQAPTEQETEEAVPDVTSLTVVAPLGATTETAEDATAAQTEEEATTASATGEEEPDTAAPVVRSPWTPGFVGVQCDRAYPPKVVDGRLLKCRFLCRGYPLLRIGFEEDGAPCLKKKTEGVCFNGKCQPLPPSTDAPGLEQETTTVRSFVTEAFAPSTSGAEETKTEEGASTDDAESVSTPATATEGEVSDTTSASKSAASATAGAEETSAITDASKSSNRRRSF
uniref:Putative secreted papa repeat protein n=1 Tax=Amblyomma cajennense TaxID=34607 RepID=A0A023FC77_AMBCJ